MQRQQNFQNIAWFRDHNTRRLLNLDPPYQRRSVWNVQYREDFVDTVLLGYPSPAIFLFESIDDAGVARYAVVDGKQRLTSVFDFIDNLFAVGDKSPLESFRGLYYDGLPKDKRNDFLRYRFSVEYLPSENEAEINNIFDRLNRNVKKLTPQELRHARYDGAFITACETLSEWLDLQFNRQFPRITESSRRQMKEVEIVASLLLYLEDGNKSYSTATLDAAFAERDTSWESSAAIQREFQDVMTFLWHVSQTPDGAVVVQSRLRNQADFFSLFAATADLKRTQSLPEVSHVAVRLSKFIDLLSSEAIPKPAADYLEAARSASNDPGPRRIRIDVMKDVILGRPLVNENGATRA